MDYFAGLDISMDETHVCVLDREGVVVYESKSESTAAAIAVELSKAPKTCDRFLRRSGLFRRVICGRPLTTCVFACLASEGRSHWHLGGVQVCT